ncbi:MAG: hypothetical protein HDR26_10790 [Lachnospiraceae bacterium]|nr:hypothetical protein [Lachnospiraceae bacterium]
MKKSILKGCILGLIFFAALFMIGRIMNKGNTDMTTEMPEAAFPVIYMDLDGQAYNELHGYAQPVDPAFQRENITVLGENRATGFRLLKFGSAVEGLSFEVRSVDGERLVENTEITDYEENASEITARIVVKDLIEENEEYELIFLVKLGGGQTVRYYTRMIWCKNYYAAEKIAYVLDFNNKTFDREASRELAKYMETNASGDNTSFHRVNIHSTLSQVAWGSLDVRREMEPVADLVELSRQTASLRLHYVVSIQGESRLQYYYVEEFYRIRYTQERTYLLEVERNMTQFFREEENVYINDKIVLGIAGEEIPFLESEDGNNFAFVVQNKLCSYNVTENKLAVLFCFYDKDNADIRTIYNNHQIKIMDVDELGNVKFAVYGYMNRGRHEGEVGIQVYYYDGARNTVEEIIYIPYGKSAGILQEEAERLLSVSRENYLYFFMGENVYEVDLYGKNCKNIIHTVQDGSLQVSERQRVIAWQTGSDPYSGTELVLMNLNNRQQSDIRAQSGEYVMPLGFMGEDLIYGYARQEDVYRDSAGRVVFPMYRVCILGTDGTILLQYAQRDTYVLKCSVEDNQINLTRCARTEDGAYTDIADDQIMNNQEATADENQVGSAVTEQYEKIVQIAVKKEINGKAVMILTPREVLYEGSRELAVWPEQAEKWYYVYAGGSVKGVFRSPQSAVNLAYEAAGIVINDEGGYVWSRGDRATRNQITAIETAEVTPEKNSVAVCLDVMLKYEGIIRNSEYLLADGQTVYEILESNLPDAQVLDLKGCSLDAVLYYVSRGIPVFASLNNGNAVLITGYNEYNIMYMDPLTGNVERKGMNDSREWLEENGNCFITYVR